MGSVILIVGCLGMQASLPSTTVGDPGSGGKNLNFRALFHPDDSLAYIGLVKPKKMQGFSNGHYNGIDRTSQVDWISQQKALGK